MTDDYMTIEHIRKLMELCEEKLNKDVFYYTDPNIWMSVKVKREKEKE